MKSAGIFGFVKNLDAFSKPVPTFNIGGLTAVNTWSGTLCTILVGILTFAFGLLKLQHLVERKNPALTTGTELLDQGEAYHLGNEDFMMAFTLESYTGKQLELDERYVRFISRTGEYRAEGKTELYYPLHLCSDAEIDEFYEAEDETTANEIEELHGGHNLFCLHSSHK